MLNWILQEIFSEAAKGRRDIPDMGPHKIVFPAMDNVSSSDIPHFKHNYLLLLKDFFFNCSTCLTYITLKKL